MKVHKAGDKGTISFFFFFQGMAFIAFLTGRWIRLLICSKTTAIIPDSGMSFTTQQKYAVLLVSPLCTSYVHTSYYRCIYLRTHLYN